MKERIQAKLKEIEVQKGVKVLYACESGSRAWGFASMDSDFDVRFIYARPLDDYLRIFEATDFIELPVDNVLDINGWDIRKTLQLFLTSNPPLYEWLQSPVIYHCNPEFHQDLVALMPAYFSLRAGCHHYGSMTKKMMELAGEEQVRIKKYFYALRTALAALWIVRKQALPPMEFHNLRKLVADTIWQQEVETLLALKAVSHEKTTTAPVPVLDQWLHSAMEEIHEKAAALPATKGLVNELDLIFRKWIQRYDV